jgi:hypothetical protein
MSGIPKYFFFTNVRNSKVFFTNVRNFNALFFTIVTNSKKNYFFTIFNKFVIH